MIRFTSDSLPCLTLGAILGVAGDEEGNTPGALGTLPLSRGELAGWPFNYAL